MIALQVPTSPTKYLRGLAWIWK